MNNLTQYEPRKRADFIAVHCSDTPPSMHIGEIEIRRWHEQRGWLDIGYNVIIRRSADIEIGRPLDYRGAHVAGYNHKSIGVCMIGGKHETTGEPEDNFTPGQYESLLITLRFLWRYAPGALAQGHRDFPGVTKTCPCFDVETVLRDANLSPTGELL